MPVPRNKRKRTENPVDNTSATSRRRRDSGTGAELPKKSDLIHLENTTISDEGNDQVEAASNITVPLHKGDDAKNGEVAEDEKLPMESPPSSEGSTDKTRLRAMLVHRKLLLARLQTMKKAAQERLSSLPPTSQTSDEEVASFRELLRHATAIARQQTKSETQQERSSVSLRRGTSVGKKMNAALSTLSSSESGLLAQPRSAGDISMTTGTRTHSAANKSLGVKRSTTPQPQQRPASAPTLAINNKAQLQRGPSLKGPPRQQQQQQRTGPAGKSISSLSINNNQLQNVVCPETAALREQKSSIQAKLRALYERRGQTLPPTKRFSKGMELKLELPPRRQTAWDVLLQEMRWMATDFREERKWKRATTRLLICAVMEKETSTKDVPSKKPDREIRSPKPPVITCSNIYDEKVDSDLMKNVARQLSSLISEKITNIVREVPRVQDENEGNYPQTVMELAESADRVEAKSMIHDKISSLVESVQNAKWDERPDLNAGQEYGLQMSEKQSEAIFRIESGWDSLQVGSVLHGSSCSGKTVLVCSLMWRRRSLGPQIVLCPPSRLIRWGHELTRFRDLRPLVLDGNSELDTLGSNDVLLCNHMSLGRLSKFTGTRKFVSLTIDCRHAFGFEGSRTHTGAPQKAAFCSSFFGSLEWWNMVNDLLNDQQRCMIIENQTSGYDLPTYARNLPHRQTLEVLALRAVLLLGEVFRTLSPRRSGPRKLLSWARRQAKNGPLKPTSLFETVNHLLLSCVKPLHVDLGTHYLDRLSQSDKDQVLWNIVPVQMTESQGKAYAECCRESQAYLSQRLSEARSISESLLQLRRCCSFVESDAAFATVSLYQATHEFPNMKSSLYSNPSWLSFDTASRLLKGSGKLQALLSILTDDCTVPSGDESSVELLLKTKISTNLPSGSFPKAKRIAIVAALPELLLMTSILLNCVGISHRLLVEPKTMPEDIVFNCWKQNQIELCEFNSEKNRLLPDIVVCSLESISGDHGGMSVESADLFVCLDEDWSGRTEVLLHQVVIRSSRRRSQEGKTPCNFLRLIAEKTCESTFLLASKSTLCRQDRIFPVQLSPVGWCDMHLIAQDEENQGNEARKRTICSFGFPAKNLLPYRDAPLSEILVTESLPPLLSHDGDVLFLPSSKHKHEKEQERLFICSMIESEWMAKAAPTEKRSSTQTTKTIEGIFSIPAYYDADAAFLLWDTANASVFSYVQKFAVNIEAVKVGPSEALILARPTSLSGPAQNDELISSGTENKESLADHHVYPGASVESLLFYPFTSNEYRERVNLYARSFGRLASAPDFFDGSQGEEPLIYTPPLLPRIVESSILAQSDAELIMSSIEDGNTKQLANEDQSDLKKLRLDDELRQSEDALFDLALDLEHEHEEKEDAAQSVPSLVEDFGMAGAGAVPLPRDSAIAASYTALVSMPHSYFQEAMDCFDGQCASDTEEASRFAQSESKMKSVILFVSRKRPRGQMVRPMTSQPGKAYRAPGSGSLGLPSSSIIGKINGVMHETNGSLSGKQIKKRKQTGPTEQAVTSPSAFTRLPHNELAHQGASCGPLVGQIGVKNKDSLKKNLLISLRQSSSGSTLFESTGFRVASSEMKNRVGVRLMSHSWTSSNALFEVGPGLPLHVVRSNGDSRHSISFEVDRTLWTSIIKKLGSGDHETGMESLKVAAEQRESFLQSLSIPCRMDFGPFHAGFLSSPSGMTYISAPKNRVGISLPMGVKVSPHSGKDTNSVDWDPKQDEQLVRSVKKFGFNWNLVAKLQTWFVEFRYIYDSHSASRGVSDSCRERWHALAKMDPLIDRGNNVQPSYAFRRKIEPPECSVVGRLFERPSFCAGNRKDQKVSIFIPETALVSQQHEGIGTSTGYGNEPMEVDQVKAARPRHTFKAFNKSKSLAMTQKIPIPGVVSGEKPSIGPSHLSHVQTVEEAVTALGASGRSEMWPLQLLVANSKRTPTGDTTKTTNLSSNGRTALHAPAPAVQQPKTTKPVV